MINKVIDMIKRNPVNTIKTVVVLGATFYILPSIITYGPWVYIGYRLYKNQEKIKLALETIKIFK